MKFDKMIRQGMLNKDVSGIMELEKQSLVSYADITKMMKGDGTVRLCKVVQLMDFLGVEIKFIIKEYL